MPEDHHVDAIVIGAGMAGLGHGRRAAPAGPLRGRPRGGAGRGRPGPRHPRGRRAHRALLPPHLPAGPRDARADRPARPLRPPRVARGAHGRHARRAPVSRSTARSTCSASPRSRRSRASAWPPPPASSSSGRTAGTSTARPSPPRARAGSAGAATTRCGGPCWRRSSASTPTRVAMAWLVARIRQRGGSRKAERRPAGLPARQPGHARRRVRRRASWPTGSTSGPRPGSRGAAPDRGRAGRWTSRARTAPARLSAPVVVACVSGLILDRIVELPPAYAAAMRAIPYRGIVCALLELSRPLSPYYWVNVTDRLGLGCVGIIEHTNFIPAERYGGRSLVYLAHYVDRDGPTWSATPDAAGGGRRPGHARAQPGLRARLDRGRAREPGPVRPARAARWAGRCRACRSRPACPGSSTPAWRTSTPTTAASRWRSAWARGSRRRRARTSTPWRPGDGSRIVRRRSIAGRRSARSACPMIVGLVVRAVPLVAAGFPLNDGGLFYAMAEDVRRAGFALPMYSSYNGVGIPFVYPPLAFYLAAALDAVRGHVDDRDPDGGAVRRQRADDRGAVPAGARAAPARGSRRCWPPMPSRSCRARSTG